MAKYYTLKGDASIEHVKVNKSGITLTVTRPTNGYESLVSPCIENGQEISRWFHSYSHCTAEEFNVAYKEAQNAIKDAYEEE